MISVPITLFRLCLISLLFIAPFLSSCAGMGLFGVKAAAITAAVGIPAAVLNKKAKEQNTVIYGNYEEGFWFDRELYFVWIISNSAEKSRQVALEVAKLSCTQRGRFPKTIYINEWEERRLFIPIKNGRFSSEIRFRCEELKGAVTKLN